MILKKHRRWIIYLIACLLFVFSQFYRSSIAVISPNLVAELNLDTEELGLISAAFFYAFAAMQIPVGLYLDSLVFATLLCDAYRHIWLSRDGRQYCGCDPPGMAYGSVRVANDLPALRHRELVNFNTILFDCQRPP